MTTATEIKAALHKRFNPSQNGREGEGFICIEEARSGAGFRGNNGACDFLAINTWESRGMTIVGHEIKCSYADWRKELALPDKAEQFSRFCHLWWVVAPADLATKIEHEVPANWGLVSVGDKGRLTDKIKPKRNVNPEPVPAWWWIGWMAQIDRQHKRRLPDLVAKQLQPERERMQQFMADHERRQEAARDEQTLKILANADLLREKTGIDLRHAYRWDLERIGGFIQLARNGKDLPLVAKQLRETAILLAEAAGLEFPEDDT